MRENLMKSMSGNMVSSSPVATLTSLQFQYTARRYEVQLLLFFELIIVRIIPPSSECMTASMVLWPEFGLLLFAMQGARKWRSCLWA